MIVLHAIWTNGTLHLWGELSLARTADSVPASSGTKNAELAGGTEPVGCDWPSVPVETLRSVVGDTYDSLLVTGAQNSHLALRLPFEDARPVPSTKALRPLDQAGQERGQAAYSLCVCRIPTLAFSPADALELLSAVPRFAPDEIRPGASLNYWCKLAGLVLELLAAQRFLPGVHHAGGESYVSFWRPLVEDEDVARRLSLAISGMPPVCRAMAGTERTVQAAALVENFLWTTVDAVVRRCLEGDELAHAIRERSAHAGTPQMRWLRSIVGPSGALNGSPEERRQVYLTIQEWLARLEPGPPARACRTCLHLHPPAAEARSAGPAHDQPDVAQRPWKLVVYAQAIPMPHLVVPARRLWHHPPSDPLLLQRPFDGAGEQVRTDLQEAMRHFPPLARCLDDSHEGECELTRQEAYTFLRDAAPILRSEGFVIKGPDWWYKERPRLQLWLDVRPVNDAAQGPRPALGLDAMVWHDWRVAVGDENLSLEEIARLAQEKEPLVRLRHRWLEVQPSDVEAAVHFLKDHRGGALRLGEALRQCRLADDLSTGLPLAGLRASGWIQSFLNATETFQARHPVPQPSGFAGALRPYQRRGLEWLAFLTDLRLGACLADEMGLGKTIQLIALWLHERRDGDSPGPTLLVVPMSLVGNWQREIGRFAPSLRSLVHHGLTRFTGAAFVKEATRHDVVITTYGLIHRDYEHLAAVEWHRIALDEAQNIKNPAAKQSAAIRSLRTTHRVALTGTPLENRLTELWTIMDFLNAGYLGSATDFRRRFATPIERQHDFERAHRLRQLVRPFILRRLKTDPRVEVDLPEKMEMKVFCNLTHEQAALYEAVVRDMLARVDVAEGMQRRGLILATLVKLKQICNHPAQFLRDGSDLPHRSGKCERIAEMLDEILAAGEKAVVFTQFREMGDLLQSWVRRTLGCDALFFHGGTTRPQREAIVEEFQAEAGCAPVLILSLKAGGYGLNLTAATHVFHFDRWWNPAVEDQATDRTHRIGQEKRVQVHKFVCVGTLEERIDAMLSEKRHLADRIIGSGEAWLTELSTEQLRDMFALSQEAVSED